MHAYISGILLFKIIVEWYLLFGQVWWMKTRAVSTCWNLHKYLLTILNFPTRCRNWGFLICLFFIASRCPLPSPLITSWVLLWEGYHISVVSCRLMGWVVLNNVCKWGKKWLHMASMNSADVRCGSTHFALTVYPIRRSI